MPEPNAAAAVQNLREVLRAKAPFLNERHGHSTGTEALDRMLRGGFPQAALTVLSGPLGSGRMSVAAQFIAAHTLQGRPAAWIDGDDTLYPPALAARGVVLERLLVVRGAREKSLYAAEQIIDSGVFGAVVVNGVDRWLTPPRARRLQLGTEGARVTTVVLASARAASHLTGAALTLQLVRRAHAIQVEVMRDRTGRATSRRARIAPAERAGAARCAA